MIPIRSSHRLTPLMFASLFGRSKVVEHLKSHGASLKSRNRLGITANFMVRLSPLIRRLFHRRQPQPSNSVLEPQLL
jgi:ankyrin repeat protein